MKGLRRLLWIALATLAPISAALAMAFTDMPARFNVPWANTAGPSYIRAIPQASQIGIQNCAASLTDGFPPLTFIPQSAGGCPPFGQDFNGILKQITQWSRWQAAGGPVFYDSTFSTQIGGYPNGSVLQSTVILGAMWRSSVDNNSTNPDDPNTAANWTRLPGTSQPGTAIATFDGFVPNAIVANGLTIGSPSSNATGLPSAAAFWLFKTLWASCGVAACPIFTSAGGASTRGATAIADWNANKQLQIPDMRGRNALGLDGGTGRLASAPAILGTSGIGGSVVGENVHTLTVAQMAAHQHSVFLKDPGHFHGGALNVLAAYNSPGGATAVAGNATTNTTTNTTGMTIGSVNGVANDNLTASSGSGTAFNLVQQGVMVQWFLAL